MSSQSISENSRSSTMVILLFTVYLLTVIIYRLFFHPLARYPGPLLAKLTDLYQTYHALNGDCHLELWKHHEKYGSVVRFGPNTLSFNTNTSLRDIYGFKTNVKKGSFYSAFWASGKHDTASTHSTIDVSTHARKRRVLSQAFSDSALKSMETYILGHIQKFCQNLQGHSARRSDDGFGESIDLSHQTNYLTFDIMGDLCFGKTFEMIERPENRFAVDLVSKATHRHYVCGMYPSLGRYYLDRMFFPRIAGGRARYVEYSKKQVTERMEIEADRKDFFFYLLNAKDPETGKGFSKAELWGESNSLIIAGSDTTATALAATIFYLLHHTPALQEVTQEVRSALTDVDEIHIGATLSNLHFLRACIEETLRLSPPVGGYLPREVCVGGITLDGEQIPAGVIVGVPHYAIHHNAKYYPDPFAFKPERWIIGAPGSTAESVSLSRSAFCPFSIGPRACIGKGMAYHELTLTLARILFLYDMRLAPGPEGHLGEGSDNTESGPYRRNVYQLKDTFTSLKEGPVVQFRARKI